MAGKNDVNGKEKEEVKFAKSKKEKAEINKDIVERHTVGNSENNTGEETIKEHNADVKTTAPAEETEDSDAEDVKKIVSVQLKEIKDDHIVEVKTTALAEVAGDRHTEEMEKVASAKETGDDHTEEVKTTASAEVAGDGHSEEVKTTALAEVAGDGHTAEVKTTAPPEEVGDGHTEVVKTTEPAEEVGDGHTGDVKTTAPAEEVGDGHTEEVKTTAPTDIHISGKEKIKETLDSEDHDVPELARFTEPLEPSQRDECYIIGLKYFEDGKKAAALHCFLTCLKDLQKTESFRSLPQCLRKIADIYYSMEEYPKAIQFIQAEKMFYETALIDTSVLEKQTKNEDNNDGDSDKPKIARADEYENLARLCLEKDQPNLALEYQGKATKLRQELYGDNHPITAKSLDFFTVIYGKVGKQQYTESMAKFKDCSLLETSEMSEPSLDKKSILKRQNTKEDKSEKKVQFQEANQQLQENEEWISHTLLWILFFLVTVALSILFFYIYCKVNRNTRSCAAWRSDLHYYYMRFKYMFYQYVEGSKTKYG